MKDKIFNEKTIKRLTQYHFILEKYEDKGLEYISSPQISKYFNIDDSQVRKDIKLLKLFIDAGVNVDLANEMRMAPIHVAIASDRLDMVKLLADSGADLESTMELEQTPLHQAVSLENLDIVKYLVSKGVNINMVDENNVSVLDYAIDEKNKDIINYFLNYGVDEEHKIQMKKIIGEN